MTHQLKYCGRTCSARRRGVEAKAKAARPGSCQGVLPPRPFLLPLSSLSLWPSDPPAPLTFQWMQNVCFSYFLRSCWYLTFSAWSCLEITESCIEGKSPDNPRWNWWHSVFVWKLNSAETSILLWILDFPLSMLPASSPSCNYLRPHKLKPDITYEKETGSSVFLEKVRSQQFSSYNEGQVTEQTARQLFLPLALCEKLHPEEVSRCTFSFFTKKALMKLHLHNCIACFILSGLKFLKKCS